MLLAEDDENDLMLFRHAVQESTEKSGIKVDIRVVYDGADAIAYLSGEGDFAARNTHPFPDLIVLDLKMPRLTGLDVLRWLRDHPEYRRVPKILLSGSSEDRDIEEAYHLCVNTYFQKPTVLSEFRELIHLMISYWAYTNRPVIRHATA